MKLKNFWFAVATSAQLKQKKILKRKLFGIPLVLIRDEKGDAVAYEDRCPHRHAPLSEGKIVNHRIQCPYHGWQFDGKGVCQHIPGLLNQKISNQKKAQTYQVIEQNKLIWIFANPEVKTESKPYFFQDFNTLGYSYDINEFVVQASLEHCLDNFMDVQHPPFIHPGLIFNDEDRSQVTVNFRKFEPEELKGTVSGIEAEYLGEPPPNRGLIGRVFSESGENLETTHVERYITPASHQNEYKVGKRSHLYVNMICTPEDEKVTRMYMLSIFKFWMPGWMARLPLKAFLKFTVNQDVDFIAKQQNTIDQFSFQEFQSTELDTHSLKVKIFLKQIETVEGLGNIPVKETSYEALI